MHRLALPAHPRTQRGILIFIARPAGNGKAGGKRRRRRAKRETGPMGMPAKIGKMPPMRRRRAGHQHSGAITIMAALIEPGILETASFYLIFMRVRTGARGKRRAAHTLCAFICHPGFQAPNWRPVWVRLTGVVLILVPSPVP